MGNTQDRVAVITGGASGIGLAVARHCVSKLGMKVVIADLDPLTLQAAVAALHKEATAAGLADPGQYVLGVRCDVTSASDNQILANAVYGNPHFGECAFVFLNAGIAIGTSVLESSVDVLKRQLDVNLYGVWYGIHAFVPAMLAQLKPSIICATSSFAGLLNTSTLGIGAGAPYTISKHAVTLTMESLAHELRTMQNKDKVRAHVLCPAAVNTNYWSRTLQNSGVDQASMGKTMDGMMKQAMEPERIAEVLAEGILEKQQFYIKGYDFSQPQEMLHAMLQARCSDIIEERPPLSHLMRDTALGKEVRSGISKAHKEGVARLQARGKL